MIHGTSTGLLHCLLRELHWQLPGRLPTIVPTDARTLRRTLPEMLRGHCAACDLIFDKRRVSNHNDRPKSVGKGVQDAMRAIEGLDLDTLSGIFGDARSTNAEPLPDKMLKDLLEHFSTPTLSIANMPEDELGNAYAFLMRRFADDSGHGPPPGFTPIARWLA